MNAAKKFPKIFLIASLIFLSACTARSRHVQEDVYEQGIVDRELTRSRAEILTKMSELQDVTVARPPVFPESRGLSTDLSYPVHLVWEGPLDQGLAALASKIGWKARRYGQSPVHDVIVFCDGEDTAMEAIDKFQAQAGNRARITLDESAKLLKVSYGSDIKGSYKRKPIRHRKERNVHHRVRHTKSKTSTSKNLPKVPSSYKPSLPQQQTQQAVQPSQTTQVRQPDPRPTQKTTSPIVNRVRPHSGNSDSMLENALGD